MIIRPMLAHNCDMEKIRFPVVLEPKIDGVRAVNFTGRLTGRSLKEHRNIHVSEMFSGYNFLGLDGEMIAGTDPTRGDLCRTTSSALSTIEGKPKVTWYVFDIQARGLPLNTGYMKRHAFLSEYVRSMQVLEVTNFDHIRVVPVTSVWNMHELLTFQHQVISEGYEGVILRDPDGLYKYGRSTIKEGGLLRIKLFSEDEAIVIDVEEGVNNDNPVKINELGFTERSTVSDNMIPSGIIGCLICKDIKTSLIISVSPGKMTHADRASYMQHPGDIIGKVIKYKHFTKGRKVLPRFPTFQCFRSAEDMI